MATTRLNYVPRNQYLCRNLRKLNGYSSKRRNKYLYGKLVRKSIREVLKVELPPQSVRSCVGSRIRVGYFLCALAFLVVMHANRSIEIPVTSSDNIKKVGNQARST